MNYVNLKLFQSIFQDMLFELVFEKISEIFKLRLNIGTLAKGERFTRSKTYTTKPASVPVTVLPESKNLFQDSLLIFF